MKNYERFLKYVKFETTSDELSSTVPSTKTQLKFAEALATEMKQLGIINVSISQYGYVYGEIPSNVSYKCPVVGFISHMDTSPDISGKNVNPQIIENYDGNDVKLNKEKNIIMKVKEFPFLKEKKGQTLICTDGTTLLGADDKAGIAEILTMCEFIIQNNVEHGTIKIAFTPDEEIGCGADHFDIKLFNADFAYTVDGDVPENVEYENFNAASCKVTINGVNIHPGSAKSKMINSISIAKEFDSMLPTFARPEHTEKYEGFNHLNEINGSVEKTTMNYIIRNHDRELFEKQKNDFMQISYFLNQKYGEDTVEVSLKDSYYNMASLLKNKMEIIDIAKKAISNIGLTPISLPIRGGTDGARLTFEGLPCPNLGTGGYNFHGRYECITIEDMEKCTNILIEIVKLVSKIK